MFASLAALMLALTVAVTAPQEAARNAPNKAAQEDDVREAVFRFQMRYFSETEKALTNPVYFLGIGRKSKDPSHALMARFHGDARVRRFSERRNLLTPEGEIRDKRIGECAVTLWLEPIRWVSSTEVETGGGHECGNMCGAGFIYRLALKNSKWVVTKAELLAIS